MKIKKSLVNILFNIDYKIAKNNNKIFDVCSLGMTMKTVVENNFSVCRYGDGELKWILGLKQSSFQIENPILSKRLKEILCTEDENILICIPEIFGDLNMFTERAQFFWKKHIIKYRKSWLNMLDTRKIYYNANITRPYMAYKDIQKSKEVFDMWKTLFGDKDILIVEGKYTRFGINNDLLEGAHSIKRILCPEKNAFECYDDIKAEVIKQSSIKKDNDLLVLIALGPTATILAYDLAKENMQAIDIGHLDVEYEWFRMGTRNKVALSNKFVNEAANNETIDLNDFANAEYDAQIVSRIF